MCTRAVMVCWSLPIIVPVAAASGRSHMASSGFRCNGLVQMAFWSSRIRFGVPRRVIGSGFGGSAGAGIAFCGVGASGRAEEGSLVTGAVAGGEGVGGETVLWARQDRPIGKRREAVRHRDAESLGRVTDIVKLG